jgi:eukaryotic-like serine/threonine-protein kinase
VEWANVYNNYGNLLAELHELPGALKWLTEGMEASRRIFGAESPEIADGMMNVANQLNALGKPREGLSMISAAKAIYEKRLGADHPKVGVALVNLCEAHRLQGQARAAAQACLAAFELLSRRLGAEHPVLATVLGALGATELQLGQLDAARGHLEKGLALGEKKRAPPNLIAALQLELAKVLFAQRRELPRAKTLAEAARVVLAGEYNAAKQVAEIDALLAKLR